MSQPTPKSTPKILECLLQELSDSSQEKRQKFLKELPESTQEIFKCLLQQFSHLRDDSPEVFETLEYLMNEYASPSHPHLQHFRDLDDIPDKSKQSYLTYYLHKNNRFILKGEELFGFAHRRMYLALFRHKDNFYVLFEFNDCVDLDYDYYFEQYEYDDISSNCVKVYHDVSLDNIQKLYEKVKQDFKNL